MVDNGQYFLIYCPSCKSECEARHDMNDYHYQVSHCVFCGHDISPDDYEILTDDEELL
jgi:hypothetical protein